MTTYYEVLGVPRNASQSEIISAYHRLILAHHPDKCEQSETTRATAKAQELNEAHHTLSDPKSHTTYDNWLSHRRKPEKPITHFEQPQQHPNAKANTERQFPNNSLDISDLINAIKTYNSQRIASLLANKYKSVDLSQLTVPSNIPSQNILEYACSLRTFHKTLVIRQQSIIELLSQHKNLITTFCFIHIACNPTADHASALTVLFKHANDETVKDLQKNTAFKALLLKLNNLPINTKLLFLDKLDMKLSKEDIITNPHLQYILLSETEYLRYTHVLQPNGLHFILNHSMRNSPDKILKQICDLRNNELFRYVLFNWGHPVRLHTLEINTDHERMGLSDYIELIKWQEGADTYKNLMPKYIYPHSLPSFYPPRYQPYNREHHGHTRQSPSSNRPPEDQPNDKHQDYINRMCIAIKTLSIETIKKLLENKPNNFLLDRILIKYNNKPINILEYVCISKSTTKKEQRPAIIQLLSHHNELITTHCFDYVALSNHINQKQALKTLFDEANEQTIHKLKKCFRDKTWLTRHDIPMDVKLFILDRLNITLRLPDCCDSSLLTRLFNETNCLKYSHLFTDQLLTILLDHSIAHNLNSTLKQICDLRNSKLLKYVLESCRNNMYHDTLKINVGNKSMGIGDYIESINWQEGANIYSVTIHDPANHLSSPSP
ncbi:MAG: J domain-containing protein [Gammaproteobacteria bacterium]|nr:J domain-containing protein [Gammaproteobacteria bacterium]